MTDSAIISPAIAASRGFPVDFTWYYKQAAALEAAGDGDVILAWDFRKVRVDKPPDVVKSYTFVPIADNVVRFLCTTPAADNHCYELVRNSSKLYFDIDKKVVGSNLTEARDAFAERLKAAVLEMLSDKLPEYAAAEFAVLDGSRALADGNVKLSFHVIIVNIALASNCDGAMKGLAERLRVALGDDAVDLGVYTKHRVFRCPFATKLGDTVGLTPLRSASSPACAQMDDATFVAKSLITNFDMDTELIAIAVAQQGSKRRNQASADGEPSSKRHVPVTDQDYSALIAALQSLLRRCGDTTTKISGFRRIEINGKLSFTCRNEEVRCCLLDPELQAGFLHAICTVDFG